jgi:sterol 3beta-glucosyltransferase
MKKLNVSVFSRALWEATHSERMVVKAKVLGEQIRKVGLPLPIAKHNINVV